MSQNIIDITFENDALADIDGALGILHMRLGGLVALDAVKRRRLHKMGDKSEAFCRQTLSVVAQNPQIVNPSLGLAGAQADLAALDALRPRRQRIQKLVERMQDTETLLGSDVMATALEAYGLLKVSGKSQGLSTLRAGLSTRFKAKSTAKRLRAANDPDGGTGKVA